MRLVCVPNWSFGRERNLVRQTCDLLEQLDVTCHFCEADIDHNRTVTAFSGDQESVFHALDELCKLILPAIDLQRHRGVHPRIGGLDVCPFTPYPAPAEKDRAALLDRIDRFAKEFGEMYQVPVFCYELSSKGKAKLLPALRKGGFGGLLDRELASDFGPTVAHQHLGASVVGWRDPLIALNVNFPSADTGTVERIAHKIRNLRREGDREFDGVRALGLHLPSQELVQVSINVTKPDVTTLDPILNMVDEMASRFGLPQGYIQLIGVIRDVDVEHSAKIVFRQEQVLPTREWNG